MVLFGAGKLPQAFSSLGKAVKNFRDAQKDEALDVTPDKQIPADGERETLEVEDRSKVETE